MAKVNAQDRKSLEAAYPAEAFANDAAQNERVPSELTHGVLIGSAPDDDGNFEIARATRHVGEPDTPHFLAPARRGEELTDQGRARAQLSAPRPDAGYAQFLDDIVVAAERFGFRAEESPGRGDPRLRGLRGG